ncbi:MAG: hypothetical protein IJS01_04470 [Lentisphaeria bacterium]|nr:hypothetical protein [Lentisphaeria bacterium]
MMKRFWIMLAAAAVLAGSGCVEPVVFAEVFQLRKDQKIYTACNIWYTDPENIDCRNIQQGSFIPVGTEIEPVGTDEWSEKITFKAAGKTFSIRFDNGIRLCSMRDYIEETFTTSTRDELFKDIPDKARIRIVRGEVVPGMDRRQVLLAFGAPAAVRTPDRKNETWIYWVSDSKTIRLVFRGDIVRKVIAVDL